MTEKQDLRQYYCRKCDRQGWLMFDENGERFVRTITQIVTNYKNEKMTIETEQTFAKECACLLRIRSGVY
jgi:hypothetical protein